MLPSVAPRHRRADTASTGFLKTFFPPATRTRTTIRRHPPGFSRVRPIEPRRTEKKIGICEDIGDDVVAPLRPVREARQDTGRVMEVTEDSAVKDFLEILEVWRGRAGEGMLSLGIGPVEHTSAQLRSFSCENDELGTVCVCVVQNTIHAQSLFQAAGPSL